MNIAIVVQGPSNNIPVFKSTFKENLIFSTWEGEEDKYLSSDIVIFGKKPEDFGPGNFNLQAISTLNGLYKAKELGYEKALKIRSDLYPTNTEKFLKIINNDCINFLAWQKNSYLNYGYFVDYLMSGKIESLIKLWNNSNFVSPISETIMTWNFFTYLKETEEVSFFLDKLTIDNDLYWLRNNLRLTTYTDTRYHTGYLCPNNESLKLLLKDYLK